ncbi:recombination regulator RecX [Clostridium sp. WILCCON 0269]|uniref:Regulatory protein RecX n=1 Tax=Candidatus Clostridium eludens TaxID=3381663 RepID=A0ABW8SH42_9CLOT
MNKHVVTKIELQKKNKDRVNIYLNEEFAFSCSAELVYSYNISKDDVLDIDYLKGIIDKDNYIKCKGCALKIIERAYKTEKQIWDKLIQKYDENTVKECMKFLKSYNFIDDDKFAEMYIKEKIHSQGRNKIKCSLIKKGIKESIVDEKLCGINSSLEEKAAFNIARKKYDVIIKNEENANKIYTKLGNYLVRNGYDFELVKNILKKIIKEYNYTSKQKKTMDLKNNNKENSRDTLYDIAKKRYDIVVKSENDSVKIYKKLGAYLLRRGYLWEDVRRVLNELIKDLVI